MKKEVEQSLLAKAAAETAQSSFAQATADMAQAEQTRLLKEKDRLEQERVKNEQDLLELNENISKLDQVKEKMLAEKHAEENKIKEAEAERNELQRKSEKIDKDLIEAKRERDILKEKQEPPFLETGGQGEIHPMPKRIIPLKPLTPQAASEKPAPVSIPEIPLLPLKTPLPSEPIPETAVPQQPLPETIPSAPAKKEDIVPAAPHELFEYTRQKQIIPESVKAEPIGIYAPITYGALPATPFSIIDFPTETYKGFQPIIPRGSWTTANSALPSYAGMPSSRYTPFPTTFTQQLLPSPEEKAKAEQATQKTKKLRPSAKIFREKLISQSKPVITARVKSKNKIRPSWRNLYIKAKTPKKEEIPSIPETTLEQKEAPINPVVIFVKNITTTITQAVNKAISTLKEYINSYFKAIRANI